MKISGLGNVQHKREVVLATIELFGTERALFASNFPVDGLRHTFSDVFSEFDHITRDFSERGTARAFSRQCGAHLPDGAA